MNKTFVFLLLTLAIGSQCHYVTFRSMLDELNAFRANPQALAAFI
jgi:hypothetical protein